jgi:hypothetical protein
MTSGSKHFCALSAAALLGLAGHALAADSDGGDSLIRRAFGSTIVSTYPDGRQAELWLQPDGSYTAEGRRRDPSSGRWQIKGAKLCMKQQKPFAAPFSYCTPLPADGLDKPWTGKAFTGEQIRIKLVKGMKGRDAKTAGTQVVGLAEAHRSN